MTGLRLTAEQRRMIRRLSAEGVITAVEKRASSDASYSVLRTNAED